MQATADVDAGTEMYKFYTSVPEDLLALRQVRDALVACRRIRHAAAEEML